MTIQEKAQYLEHHAQEYVRQFDGGQLDYWLLQRAEHLLNQADRVKRGENIRLRTPQGRHL